MPRAGRNAAQCCPAATAPTISNSFTIPHSLSARSTHRQAGPRLHISSRIPLPDPPLQLRITFIPNKSPTLLDLSRKIITLQGIGRSRLRACTPRLDKRPCVFEIAIDSLDGRLDPVFLSSPHVSKFSTGATKISTYLPDLLAEHPSLDDHPFRVNRLPQRP